MRKSRPPPRKGRPPPRQSRLKSPSPISRPIRVAVTGGIGAGKTEALQAFRRHGAAVLSSDDVVHRLYAEDLEVRAALEQRFGTTDRARIAEVVFADAAELEWLERLLHPRVRERYTAWLEGVQAPVAVVEIPLLYEAGSEVVFDAVVLITAPRELREERRGAMVASRSPRLISDDEKAERADFVFVNDESLGALDAFVTSVLERLQQDT